MSLVWDYAKESVVCFWSAERCGVTVFACLSCETGCSDR